MEAFIRFFAGVAAVAGLPAVDVSIVGEVLAIALPVSNGIGVESLVAVVSDAVFEEVLDD